MAAMREAKMVGDLHRHVVGAALDHFRLDARIEKVFINPPTQPVRSAAMPIHQIGAALGGIMKWFDNQCPRPMLDANNT